MTARFAFGQADRKHLLGLSLAADRHFRASGLYFGPPRWQERTCLMEVDDAA